MIDSVYESFLGMGVFVIAYLVAAYVVKVTTITKVFTGFLLVVIFAGYICVLLDLEGASEIMVQLSNLSEYTVMADYGKYIGFFLFYVCFLNSVGIGKK